MKYIKIPCNPANYGSRRSHNDVWYIVIHYTAGTKDTAENEGNYFARNKVKASAHFFVDRTGKIVKSVDLSRVAWSVGGKKYPNTKGGKYYGKCTNNNSVSIELCAIADKDPSAKQIQAVRECIQYIQTHCPNAKIIIRHYDVTGKLCPLRMVDENKWKEFKEQLNART